MKKLRDQLKQDFEELFMPNLRYCCPRETQPILWLSPLFVPNFLFRILILAPYEPYNVYAFVKGLLQQLGLKICSYWLKRKLVMFFPNSKFWLSIFFAALGKHIPGNELLSS